MLVRMAIALLVLAVPGLTQQLLPCSASVETVSVVLPDGRVVRGLDSQSFEVRADRKPVSFALSADNSPRRILLLFDLNRRINEAAWQAIVASTLHLIERARPEDRFGLLTFGGHPVFLDLDTPRSVLLGKIRSFGAQRPEAETGRVLVRDALADALKAFDPPRYGDAILMFFGGEDQNSKLSLEKVREQFERKPIRIFGFTFGMLYSGTQYGAEVAWGNPFYEMVAGSGGAILIGFTGHPWRTFELSDEILEQSKTGVWRVYGQIVETYRVEVAIPRVDKPRKWSIELSAAMNRRLQNARIRSTSKIAPCPDASAGVSR